MSSTKLLWLRESDRRKAIWQLDRLVPGDPRAEPILQRLVDIEQLDLVEPLADCHLCLQQLLELPREAHRVGYQIVRDEHIPEPWLTRFAVAHTGAARVTEGYYWHDWTDFLQAWSTENDHIDKHKRVLPKG